MSIENAILASVFNVLKVLLDWLSVVWPTFGRLWRGPHLGCLHALVVAKRLRWLHLHLLLVDHRLAWLHLHLHIGLLLLVDHRHAWLGDSLVRHVRVSWLPLHDTS